MLMLSKANTAGLECGMMQLRCVPRPSPVIAHTHSTPATSCSHYYPTKTITNLEHQVILELPSENQTRTYCFSNLEQSQIPKFRCQNTTSTSLALNLLQLHHLRPSEIRQTLWPTECQRLRTRVKQCAKRFRPANRKRTARHLTEA